MKITIKQMILTALFAALTAIGAFISIPIGPVPISLQTLFSILSGMILGSKLGPLSQIVYMTLGLIGLPIFTGGVGGLQAIYKPSFGYVLGFILGSYVIGKICEKEFKPPILKYIIASIIGTLAIYAIGVPYLYFILTKFLGKAMSFYAVLKTGFFVFLPGDLAKCAVAAIISSQVVPILKKSNLL